MVSSKQSLAEAHAAAARRAARARVAALKAGTSAKPVVDATWAKLMQGCADCQQAAEAAETLDAWRAFASAAHLLRDAVGIEGDKCEEPGCRTCQPQQFLFVPQGVVMPPAPPKDEPTPEEIQEYAEWLGMHSPEDDDLRWIAREALKAPLPEHWKPCKTNDGEIYYFNFATGESVWDHPCDDYYKKLYEEEKGKKARGGSAKRRDSSQKKSSGIQPLSSMLPESSGPSKVLGKLAPPAPSGLFGGMAVACVYRGCALRSRPSLASSRASAQLQRRA